MTHKSTHSHLVLPLIFLGIATPFFVAALGVTHSVVGFIRNSEKMDGHIVQIVAPTGELRLGKRALTQVDVPVDTYGEYYPMIEYPCGGQTGRFRQKEKFNYPPEIGASVPLRISRINCSDVRGDNFMDLWFLPALLFSISTPMVLLGALLLRSSIRNRRRASELPSLGRKIECSDISLGPDPYTRKDGKNPMRITARFQIDGLEHFAHGPSLWEHPPVPDSVTILYHPDDPGICEIAEIEKTISSK